MVWWTSVLPILGPALGCTRDRERTEPLPLPKAEEPVGLWMPLGPNMPVSEPSALPQTPPSFSTLGGCGKSEMSLASEGLLHPKS